MDVSPAIPGTVTNGANAGWNVKIWNDGNSNIAAVNLATSKALTASFIGDATWMKNGVQVAGPARPCDAVGTSGPLSCGFGNVTSGESVSLTIAFPTPNSGNSLDFEFWATGKGNTTSDGLKHTSHGDTLPGLAHVDLSSTPGFAGGFVVNKDDPISALLGNQQTSIVPPTTGIGVTIRQGSGSTNCSGGTIGQVVTTAVGTGGPYAPFKTTLTYDIRGINQHPNSFAEATIDQIGVCHAYDAGPDAGNSVLINQACTIGADGLPAETPCIVATFSDPNGTHDGSHHPDADEYDTLTIELWDIYNGGMRGAW